MSRIVTHNETFTGIPTSYSASSTSYTLSATSAYASSANTSSYAQLKGRSNTHYYTNYNFSVTGIPSNASITSTVCALRARVQGTSSSYTGSTQLYSNSTAKGSVAGIKGTTSTGVVYTISDATFTLSELSNVYLKFNHPYGGNNRYIYFYGATLKVDYSYDDTYYEFTCISSVQGVGMTSGETLSGGSFTATLTGISDISSVIIKDNGTDVTSTFTKSGNNYVKAYSNVDSDHSITIETSAIPTIPSFVKKNSQYKQVSKAYKKNGNAWEEKSILSVMWKINNAWTSTTSSMSGKTAFKTEQ